MGSGLADALLAGAVVIAVSKAVAAQDASSFAASRLLDAALRCPGLDVRDSPTSPNSTWRSILHIEETPFFNEFWVKGQANVHELDRLSDAVREQTVEFKHYGQFADFVSATLEDGATLVLQCAPEQSCASYFGDCLTGCTNPVTTFYETHAQARFTFCDTSAAEHALLAVRTLIAVAHQH